VEMVLGHVDRVSLVACRFVCTTWMRTTPWHEDESLPRLHEHTSIHPRGSLNCALRSVGAGQRLSLERVDVRGQLSAATLTCSSGPTAVSGTNGRVIRQKWEAIPNCSGGRSPTAVPEWTRAYAAKGSN
jgi:hypothetical protein